MDGVKLVSRLYSSSAAASVFRLPRNTGAIVPAAEPNTPVGVSRCLGYYSNPRLAPKRRTIAQADTLPGNVTDGLKFLLARNNSY
jgi:hypothetical protein